MYLTWGTSLTRDLKGLLKFLQGLHGKKYLTTGELKDLKLFFKPSMYEKHRKNK